MKNRYKLGKMALIDMLYKFKENSGSCAFNFLVGESRPKGKSTCRCDEYKYDCYMCISHWLNEEEE